MMDTLLVDRYGRRVKNLRIALTKRCNLRCIYCHGEGEAENRSNRSVREIDPTTIHTLTEVAVKHGVEKIKFSGGEPLLRRDLPDILSDLPDLKDVSLTTNGTLLSKRAEDLADSGLDRVNVSLDTLRPEVYRLITQTNRDYHTKVLDGIHAAISAGLTPVKVNMVLLGGLNDSEVWDMVEFTRGCGEEVILQLIELMSFKGLPERVVEVDMNEIEKRLDEKASHSVEREMHRRRKYYIDGAEVELVRPIDNSTFCQNCNRLRVTSDGKLKTCLLHNKNLIDIMGRRRGEMEELLQEAVLRREPYYKPEEEIERQGLCCRVNSNTSS